MSTTFVDNIKLGVWGGTVPMFKLCPALHTIEFDYLSAPGFLMVPVDREAHKNTGPHRLKSNEDVLNEVSNYTYYEPTRWKTARSW